MLKSLIFALAALVAAPLFGLEISKNEGPRPLVLEQKAPKGFAVRAGFFVQKSNAEKLVKSLAEKGHDNAAVVEAETKDGNVRGFSVVLSRFDGKGLFSSRPMAETYLEQLQKKYKKDASLGPVFEKGIVVEL